MKLQLSRVMSVVVLFQGYYVNITMFLEMAKNQNKGGHFIISEKDDYCF